MELQKELDGMEGEENHEVQQQNREKVLQGRVEMGSHLEFLEVLDRMEKDAVLGTEVVGNHEKVVQMGKEEVGSRLVEVLDGTEMVRMDVVEVQGTLQVLEGMEVEGSRQKDQDEVQGSLDLARVRRGMELHRKMMVPNGMSFYHRHRGNRIVD